MEKYRKKERWVIILLALVLVILFGTFISIQINESSNQTEIIQYENGDYVYCPSEENLSYDEDTATIYYNNMVVVYLTREMNEDETTSLAKSINGNVVGNISGIVNILQIHIKESDYKEICAKENKLMENDDVLYATYEYPVDISEEVAANDDQNDTEVENTENPWEASNGEHSAINNDGNEDDPAGNDWWAESIGAYSAWSFVDSHADEISPITVGVVDIGFDIEHEDLQSEQDDRIRVIGRNEAKDHGTHVVGIINAQNNSCGIRGIADDANVVFEDYLLNGISVSKSEDSTQVEYTMTSTQLFASEINLIKDGVKIINNSWGHTLYSKSKFQSLESLSIFKVSKVYDNYLIAFENRCKEEAREIIILMALILKQKDALIVQAAGNGYDDVLEKSGIDAKLNGAFCSISEEVFESLPERTRNHLSGITYEEIKNHIIIVSGYAEDDENSIYNGFNYGDAVDICAPGVNIFSLLTTRDDPGNKPAKDGLSYGTLDGTSMSAPMVTGAAALIWKINPTLSAEEVKNILLKTARIGNCSNKNDTRSEYPMLDLKAAVKQAVRYKMGTVEFSVYDEQNNSLSDVMVTMSTDYTDDDFYNYTWNLGDNSDSVAITAIGNCILKISKDGYESQEVQVSVAAYENKKIDDIVLKSSITIDSIIGTYYYNMTPEEVDEIRANDPGEYTVISLSMPVMEIYIDEETGQLCKDTYLLHHSSATSYTYPYDFYAINGTLFSATYSSSYLNMQLNNPTQYVSGTDTFEIGKDGNLIDGENIWYKVGNEDGDGNRNDNSTEGDVNAYLGTYLNGIEPDEIGEYDNPEEITLYIDEDTGKLCKREGLLIFTTGTQFIYPYESYEISGSTLKANYPYYEGFDMIHGGFIPVENSSGEDAFTLDEDGNLYDGENIWYRVEI